MDLTNTFPKGTQQMLKELPKQIDQIKRARIALEHLSGTMVTQGNVTYLSTNYQQKK